MKTVNIKIKVQFPETLHDCQRLLCTDCAVGVFRPYADTSKGCIYRKVLAAIVD